MKQAEESLIGCNNGAEFGSEIFIDQLTASRDPICVADKCQGRRAVVCEGGLRECVCVDERSVLRIGNMGIPGVQFAKGAGVTVLADRKHARVLFWNGQVPGDKAAKQKKKR